MQYDFKYRYYRDGRRISNNFDDLVGDHIKIYLRPDMYESHTGLKTPFVNISLKPFAPPQHLIDFINHLKIEKKSIQDVFRELKKEIFARWMPNKIHLIGSSSGYDSRLIAKAIQELKKEHGKDWLGETYFVECGGEGTAFKAIMDRLRFKNYIIWTPDYDFEYFNDFHKRFNGLCAFPMNIWYDYFINNWKEEDVQYFSGYGGNVADAMNNFAHYMQPIKRKWSLRTRLLYYFKYQYHYQIAAFRELKYSFHPFWSYRYISAAAGLHHRHRRTAEYLSYYVVPECRNIARMRLNYEVKRLGHRKIKKDVMDKLYEWYLSTDYGKNNPVTPFSLLEYHKWWLQLCIASYLENRGYERK